MNEEKLRQILFDDEEEEEDENEFEVEDDDWVESLDADVRHLAISSEEGKKQVLQQESGLAEFVHSGQQSQHHHHNHQDPQKKRHRKDKKQTSSSSVDEADEQENSGSHKGKLFFVENDDAILQTIGKNQETDLVSKVHFDSNIVSCASMRFERIITNGPRRAHYCCAFTSKNSLYMFGGVDEKGICHNDFCSLEVNLTKPALKWQFPVLSHQGGHLRLNHAGTLGAHAMMDGLGQMGVFTNGLASDNPSSSRCFKVFCISHIDDPNKRDVGWFPVTAGHRAANSTPMTFMITYPLPDETRLRTIKSICSNIPGRCPDPLSEVKTRVTSQIGKKAAAAFGLVPPLQHCSVTVTGSGIWLFGGIVSSHSYQNTMFEIVLSNNVALALLVPIQAGSPRPCPRAGHVAQVIGSFVYVFGGTNGTTEFNDLWAFDTNSRQWTQIEVMGALPPPLAFSGSFTVQGQYLYVIGGCSKNQPQSGIFRFDTAISRWSLVKPNNGTLFDARLGFECVPVGANLVIHGGIGHQGAVLGDTLLFRNYFEIGSQSPSIVHMGRMLKKGIFSDVTLITRRHLPSKEGADSSSNLTIRAHRFVLAARCPYFARLFIADRFSGTEIHIDEFDGPVFKKFIKFLYTGTMMLNGEEQVKEMARIARFYSDDTALKLCRRHGCFLDQAHAIRIQLEHDLVSTINDTRTSDLVLSSGDGSQVAVHKAMLSRSKFFEAMFESGMSESVDKHIEMEAIITRDALLALIHHIYHDDTTRVNKSTCVELYVAAQLFDLPELKEICRDHIISALSPEVINDLSDVAQLYRDGLLSAHIRRFIRNQI